MGTPPLQKILVRYAYSQMRKTMIIKIDLDNDELKYLLTSLVFTACTDSILDDTNFSTIKKDLVKLCEKVKKAGFKRMPTLPLLSYIDDEKTTYDDDETLNGMLKHVKLKTYD